MKYSSAIVVIIYLAAQSFFNPFDAISDQNSKLYFYILALLGLIIAYSVPRSIKLNKRIKKIYIFFLFSFVFSVISCTLFQEQAIKTSLIATLPYFFSYSYLYTVAKLNPGKSFVIKFVIILQILSVIMFVLNLSVFPNTLFGKVVDEIDESRGAIRLPVPMLEFHVLGLLYGINQCLVKFKKKYLFLAVLSFTMILVCLTRQYIFLSIILVGWMLFKKFNIKGRIVLVLFVLLINSLVLPNLEVYQAIKSLNEHQAEMRAISDGDIREKSIEFYVFEYQKNALTPLFGNGIPSIENSRYGQQWNSDINGRLYVDVGWAGFYFLFGGISTVLLLVLLVYGIKTNKLEEEQYLSYWLTFVILTSMASAPILYHHQVVSICLVLYLVFSNGKNSNTISVKKS